MYGFVHKMKMLQLISLNAMHVLVSVSKLKDFRSMRDDSHMEVEHSDKVSDFLYCVNGPTNYPI